MAFPFLQSEGWRDISVDIARQMLEATAHDFVAPSIRSSARKLAEISSAMDELGRRRSLSEERGRTYTQAQ
jgi:hypothetical protein